MEVEISGLYPSIYPFCMSKETLKSPRKEGLILYIQNKFIFVILFEMILFQVTFRPRPNAHNFSGKYVTPEINFHSLVYSNSTKGHSKMTSPEK